MEKTIILKKPKWLRRIASSFLDLLIAFVVGIILSFATTPLSNLLFNGNEAKKIRNDIVCATHIYVLSNNGDLVANDNITTLDDDLTYFYENYKPDLLKEYNDKKKNYNGLFVYNEDTDSYVEPASIDYNDPTNRLLYEEFYYQVRDDIINNYIDDILNDNEEFKKANNKLFLIDYTSLLISSSITLIIFYIFVPMINKEYKTIGKIAFKLKVVSKVSLDTKPTRLQALFRQLVLVLFEYTLTISTIGLFGIPIPIVLIISIVMELITKYHQTFHDFVCQTIVVDDSSYEKINASERYEITFINVKEDK